MNRLLSRRTLSVWAVATALTLGLPFSLAHAADESADVFIKRVSGDILDAIKADVESRRASNTVGILISLGAIVFVIFVGTTWLVRSIREPLAIANDLAARIAEGDLTHSVHSDRTDEFGQLLHSLEAMNISLGRMVSEIRGGTDSIAIASAEIATGNNDLAQRTEQTSGNLQATASSMDGLTNTVQHSAESARQASALAANASTSLAFSMNCKPSRSH